MARASSRQWSRGTERVAAECRSRSLPLLGRNRLVDDLAARTDDEERIGAEREDGARGLLLARAEERAAVPGEQLAEDRDLVVTRRTDVDLRALREPRSQAVGIDAARRVKTDEHGAARHPGTDPASRI